MYVNWHTCSLLASIISISARDFQNVLDKTPSTENRHAANFVVIASCHAENLWRRQSWNHEKDRFQGIMSLTSHESKIIGN